MSCKRVLVALLALFASACAVHTAERTLVDPAKASTLDHRSPYLKAHMQNGIVYVFSDWR